MNAYNSEVPLFVLLLVLPPRFKVGLLVVLPKLNAMMSIYRAVKDETGETEQDKDRVQRSILLLSKK